MNQQQVLPEHSGNVLIGVPPASQMSDAEKWYQARQERKRRKYQWMSMTQWQKPLQVLDAPLLKKSLVKGIFGDDMVDADHGDGNDISPEQRLQERKIAAQLGDSETRQIFQNSFVTLSLALLSSNIYQLGERGNSEEKADILEWLTQPYLFADRYLRDQDGYVTEVIPVYSDTVPFTFWFCCRLRGLTREQTENFAHLVLQKINQL